MKLWPLALLSGIALAVTACENKQQQPTPHQETNPPPVAETKQPVTLDPYATDPYANQPAAQPRDTGTAGGGAARATPPPKASSSKGDTLVSGGKTGTSKSAGGKTYTVQKGDTLSSIAKKFYGDSSRWKEIQHANKGAVPEPSKLKVGTKLVIP